MSGYVYFSFSKALGITKIGSSKKPVQRLRQLGANAPWEMELLFTIKDLDFKLIEKSLHKKFAKDGKKVPGTNEYFYLTLDDISEITKNFNTDLKSFEWANIANKLTHIEVKRKCFDVCRNLPKGDGELLETINQFDQLIQFASDYRTELLKNRQSTFGELEESEKPPSINLLEQHQTVKRLYAGLETTQKTKGGTITSPVKWLSLFDEFHIHLKDECENELTVKGYLNDVSKFLNYIEAELKDLFVVDQETMKAYLNYLGTEGYNLHSIARQLSALRNFFKFLRNKGLMSINPLDNVKQPHLEPRLNKITDTDFLEMEVYVKNHSNEKSRDLTLLYLLYYEKLRVSEVVKLKKKDFINSQLIINSKVYTLHSKTNELISHQFNNSKTENLLQNAHNKPLTVSGAHYILKNIFNNVGMANLRPIDLSKKLIR